ncbi:hypothetical protein RN01_01380 [Cupriavidus sp. SHE]|nr:hypothetical protein RN01_01380 [Cupriavidus sp. SHE]
MDGATITDATEISVDLIHVCGIRLGSVLFPKYCIVRMSSVVGPLNKSGIQMRPEGLPRADFAIAGIFHGGPQRHQDGRVAN